MHTFAEIFFVRMCVWRIMTIIRDSLVIGINWQLSGIALTCTFEKSWIIYKKTLSFAGLKIAASLCPCLKPFPICPVGLFLQFGRGLDIRSIHCYSDRAAVALPLVAPCSLPFVPIWHSQEYAQPPQPPNSFSRGWQKTLNWPRIIFRQSYGSNLLKQHNAMLW